MWFHILEGSLILWCLPVLGAMVVACWFIADPRFKEGEK